MFRKLSQRQFTAIVVDLSKRVMIRARNIYSGVDGHYRFQSRSKNETLATRMMSDVSMTLSRNRKISGMKPGIHEIDIEYLAKYEKDNLSNVHIMIKPIGTR